MVNKKGLSTIVATVLIILITVSAAVILFQQIVPFVRDNLESSTECVPYKEYFTFDSSMEYNCYNSARLVAFSVKALNSKKDGSDLDSFSVIFNADGASKKVIINNSDLTSTSAGGVRMLDLNAPRILMPKSGEIQTFVYNSNNIAYNSISIAPILKSGRQCDISDSVNLEFCVTNPIS